MKYTYIADKTIERNGVRYFFSNNAYRTMQYECKLYGLEIDDDDVLLMYCNNFEVI